MCGGEVELKGLLQSEDVNLMRQALANLGFKIHGDANNYKINGTDGLVENKECSINVGNAGTIARFLTCFLSSQKKVYLVCMDLKPCKKDPCLNCLIAWRT